MIFLNRERLGSRRRGQDDLCVLCMLMPLLMVVVVIAVVVLMMVVLMRGIDVDRQVL
jgi:hypothetical protein